MIFELVKDFANVLEAMPEGHPRYRILKLLNEAIRRDVHFIDRHPTTFFQCMWNTCWWYDCSQWWRHYKCRRAPRSDQRFRLSRCLENWRINKETTEPGFLWLRSCRPQSVRLGSGQKLLLRMHKNSVNSSAYSPDGKAVATGSYDGTARVWDAYSGEVRVVFRGHKGPVNSVAYSPDGRRIASCSGSILNPTDNTVRLWDSESGDELLVLYGHKRAVNSVAWSPDGDRIVSGSYDGAVCTWDAQSGRKLSTVRAGSFFGSCNCVTWSPEGGQVAIAAGSIVSVMDPELKEMIAYLHGHSSEVNCIAYSAGGHQLASACSGHTVVLWDTTSWKRLVELSGHEGEVYSVCYSSDGRWITSGSEDRTVRVWNSSATVCTRIRNLICGRKPHVFVGHEMRVQSVAYSPDSSRIVSTSSDGTARIWDAENGDQHLVLRGHDGYVTGICYSPDGDRIASASNDSSVRVWEADSGLELAVLRGHEDLVSSISYSPDGRHIVSTSYDNTLRVWNAHDGTKVAILRGHADLISSVDYSPDGRQLVSGSWDGSVRVWDAETGDQLAVFWGERMYRQFGRHIAHVESVTFSPCESQVACGFDNNTVELYDITSRRRVAILCGHESGVNSVCYSPDGRRITSGSDDNTVRVWDTERGAELMSLYGHTGSVTDVAYSPDSRRIVSSSGNDRRNDGVDNTVRVWDTVTGSCEEVIKGRGDLRDIAQGGSYWRALARERETLIESAVSGNPAARFPVAFRYITSSPNGLSWAGTSGSQVYIIRIESKVEK